MARPLSPEQWTRLGALLAECLLVSAGQTQLRGSVRDRLRSLPLDQHQALERYLAQVVAKLKLPAQLSTNVFELMPVERPYLERIRKLVEHDFDAMELADSISG